MTSNHAISANGKVYDAVTGLPVAAPAPAPRPAKVQPSTPVRVTTAPKVAKPSGSHPINHAKRRAQKSTTLRRDLVKKPATAGTTHKVAASHTNHVAKSPMVRKFAPHPKPLHEKKDLHPTPVRPQVELHPVVARTQDTAVHHALQSNSRRNNLMSERLAAISEPPSSHRRKTRMPKRLFSRQPRLRSVLAASLAIMVLGGYLTYLSLPGLSVRVAASQAGIAASFPDYHPDGYRFDGPVAFAPGRVAVTFRSNSNGGAYTLTQQKSTWDSQAVYDNVVAKVAGKNYATNSQNGLTIYTFSNKAAWINKGILYTVTGTAALSDEQLLRIAGSV